MTSRRRFLGYFAAAAATAGSGALAGRAVDHGGAVPDLGPVASLSPYGEHQAGVLAPAAPAVHVVALDLRRGVDASALGRLLRLWTGDVEALMAGRGPLGDPAPELAAGGNGLSVTVGLGHGAFRVAGLPHPAPPGLSAVPPMRHDALDPAWCGGDLVLLVGADEATSVDHAVRRLLTDAAPFATLRWRQRASWRGTDERGRRVTGRNLFGQVDGTGNPTGRLLAETVWATGPSWFAGGTTLAVRRIRLDLDGWDRLTRAEQEAALGRRLADGAPLTGRHERDAVDLAARDGGRPVIAPDAHVRLAHPSSNGGLRILRKGVNWTAERATPDGPVTESGLLFLSFQADVARQLVPLQRRLDEGDALNRWTTTVGSAEFAVLPGFRPGGWLGQRLLEA